MNELIDLRTLAEAAGDAWEDAPEFLKPVLKECADRLLTAADEIERMTATLSRIQAVPGCECDSYEGHKCLMCRVREIAREGLAAEKAMTP